MSPDDRGRMYFLACDHPASFRRSLFGQDVLTPVTAARIGMTYQSLTRVFAQAAAGGG